MMNDSNNIVSCPSFRAATTTEKGVSRTIPTDDKAMQQPRASPSNDMQVEVPSMQSLHTQDDDAYDTSNPSPSGQADEEEPVFTREFSPSKPNADTYHLPHRTNTAKPSYSSTEKAGESNDDVEPSHAPDEEPPLLFSTPSSGPPLLRRSRNKDRDDKPADSKTSPLIENKGIGDDGECSPAKIDKDASRGMAAMPTLPPNEPAPELIDFYDNPDDDGYGLRSLLEAITSPQLLLRIQYAFRTVGLVTFPLFTIALHPNTRYRLGFPQMLIASVVSTSTHRPTVGEQIGLHSWTWRGIIFMLIWGSAVDAWGVAYHVGAWYGLLAAGIFGAGLVNNGNMRRFMLLYFFLYMLELRTHQHYFTVVPMSDAAYSAADYLIGSLVGVAANSIPFPSLVRDTVDMVLTKIFGGFGKLLFGMINYTWSPDVHAAAFFYDDRTPFVTIEAVLSHMSALLWFASWEPMEFPLRNSIRRLKLALLRRLLALAYAAFSCGRTYAAFRQHQSDKAAMRKIRYQLYEAAQGNPVKALEDVQTSHLSLNNGKPPSVHDEATAAKASVEALRANSHTYVKDFASVLMQATALIGSTESTPEQLLKKVPFDTLREKETAMRRNLRLELVQVMKIQSDMVARQRAQEQAAAHARGEAEEIEEDEKENDGISSDSVTRQREGESHAPCGAAKSFRVRKADARLILEHRAVIDTYEVFLRINEIFFNLLMGMIAGEIINFGEQLKEYKPAESLFRRWWRHYIVEAWDGFWSELWFRITLARPTDLRTVKDSIRMTCAYLAATALNIELWKPLNGLYFFGVTPLLGLPVEEESLGLGICRIGGNTMGCALGYLAYHNTTNFAQQIATTLCFCFLLQICKYHAQYGQFFFYGSIITLAGLATAMIFNELVVRLVTSSYTVMAYLICCLFLFPNDCRKICFNYRCKLTKVLSETVDDVAVTARLTIECNDGNNRDDDEDDGGRGTNEPVTYPSHNTEAMLMCSQLNVELTLVERLLGMCDKWAPFAASELVIRGMAQFPTGPNSLISFAHERMVANLRLLVFGVQLLHRPRAAPPSPNIAHFIRTGLADFLDDFADAVRLVGADYVQALQRSRTWSYPRHLTRVSQMRRLRVRLHALMYECYVLVANNMSKGTFGMTLEDYQQMQRDGAGQGTAADAAPAQPGGGGEGKAPPPERDVHANLSFLPGAGGNPAEGMTAPPTPPPPPPLSPSAGTAAENTKSAAPAAHIVVSAGDEPATNLFFADRFLVARRDEALTEEGQTPSSFPSRRASPLSSSPQERPCLLDDAGNERDDDVPPPPPQQQQAGSPPHSFSSLGHGSFAPTSALADPERPPSAATSVAGRRRPGLYVHRAQLQQSGAEPTEAWPPTIGNAESEVEQLLDAEKKKSEREQQMKQRTELDGAADSNTAVAEGSAPQLASPLPEYAPVVPTKANRNVSKLILFPAKGPETYIPLYNGPAFTFMEDELDMPADTDFSAISTILLSCGSIMAEFESLPGCLNSLTNYDKQLQETSVATSFLDKWSAKLVGYRKTVHDRYHYPKPPPERRRPMHTQEDPWEDWKF